MALAWAAEGRLPALDPSSGPAGRRAKNFKLLPLVMSAGWIVGASIAYCSVFCAAHHVGLLSSYDGPAKTALGLLLFELGDWTRHYAFHKVGPLWRLHRVHHSDERLDFTSAFRNHPIENFGQGVFYVAIIALFGVPLASLLWRTPLLFAALIFQHSNLALPRWLDHAVSYVTPSPRQHRVHHSPDPSRADTNFGVIFTLWDRLFGTFVYPREDESMRTGVE